jgi:hypothetical protein
MTASEQHELNFLTGRLTYQVSNEVDNFADALRAEGYSPKQIEGILAVSFERLISDLSGNLLNILMPYRKDTNGLYECPFDALRKPENAPKE